MKNSEILCKIIIPVGVIPEKHELEVASLLAAKGKDIEFLAPVYAKGVFTPDLQIDGRLWEIKSPCGNSKRTIENNFRKALKQSENIIFDLRRIELLEKVAISQIKKIFLLHRGNKMRRITIITKDNKILDFD
jgi:hypothetical protein